MGIKGKIMSALSMICLCLVLVVVGVWALTNTNFTVSGDIEYTAPKTSFTVTLNFMGASRLCYFSINGEDFQPNIMGTEYVLEDVKEIQFKTAIRLGIVGIITTITSEPNIYSGTIAYGTDSNGNSIEEGYSDTTEVIKVTQDVIFTIRLIAIDGNQGGV